jgi:glycosyltransferase involved in cell wall biosynthesis
MHRICGSLARAGYDVTLVGRVWPHSPPLAEQPFGQKRLRCRFNTGFLFYAEYNIRLLFFLYKQHMHAICAIDLDTILPCLFISMIKKVPRVYDAHEYFTEMKEVRTRPLVRIFWKIVEKLAVPRFENGYTVSDGLANQFASVYQRNYRTIRNLPLLKPMAERTTSEPFLIFTGAVNEARGFEFLIPAMKHIPYPLVVCGDGNFMPQLKALIQQHEVADKVILKGMMKPADLWTISQRATLGLGLAEKEGINQFYALPNKFTEYVHAGIPQVAMNYPEYQKLNQQFEVAVLLDELSVEIVHKTINDLMSNEDRLNGMRMRCLEARQQWCWQKEENILIDFYQELLPVE